jgi:zinc protease
VLSERDVILEERRTTVDNVPAAVLDEMISAKMFGTKSYGVPLIGYAREIAQLNRADALAFYRLHYAPNNAILVIAGDVEMAAVLPLARKYYGAVARRDVPARSRSLDAALTKAERVEHRDRRVRQIEWGRDYVAPSYRVGATQHAVPLQVLAQILGGNQTSRLYRLLVVEGKLATSASAAYNASSLGLTQFGIGASLAPGVKPEDLERAMDGAVADLLANGITEAELKQAKTRMLAANIYGRDSLGTGARIFGAGLAIGRSIEEIDGWPAQIQAVTAEQVMAAARAVLVLDRSVTSLLLPAAPPGQGGGR